jgi:hypothetical protein
MWGARTFSACTRKTTFSRLYDGEMVKLAIPAAGRLSAPRCVDLT